MTDVIIDELQTQDNQTKDLMDKKNVNEAVNAEDVYSYLFANLYDPEFLHNSVFTAEKQSPSDHFDVFAFLDHQVIFRYNNAQVRYENLMKGETSSTESDQTHQSFDDVLEPEVSKKQRFW